MVSAPGHVTLTTHVFVAGSPYLTRTPCSASATAWSSNSMQHPPGKAVDGREMKMPYHSASYDFRLAPVAEKMAA